METDSNGDKKKQKEKREYFNLVREREVSL